MNGRPQLGSSWHRTRGHLATATHGCPITSKRTTVPEILQEAVLMMFFVPVQGPPAILLACSLALFVLLLTPPAALLVALVVASRSVQTFSSRSARSASPYLLLRHLRAASGRRPSACRSRRWRCRRSAIPQAICPAPTSSSVRADSQHIAHHELEGNRK